MGDTGRQRIGMLLFGLVWTLAEDRLLISGKTRFLVLTGNDRLPSSPADVKRSHQRTLLSPSAASPQAIKSLIAWTTAFVCSESDCQEKKRGLL